MTPARPEQARLDAERAASRRTGPATRMRPGGGASAPGGDERLRPLALGRNADDVPGQSDPRHRQNQDPRDVELIPAEPVKRRAREGVVVVVPGLPERERRQPPDVGRQVVDVEPAAAEDVADRVDRPGDVVNEEDPDETAPDQAPSRAGE